MSASQMNTLSNAVRALRADRSFGFSGPSGILHRKGSPRNAAGEPGIQIRQFVIAGFGVDGERHYMRGHLFGASPETLIDIHVISLPATLGKIIGSVPLDGTTPIVPHYFLGDHVRAYRGRWDWGRSSGDVSTGWFLLDTVVEGCAE